MRRYRIELRAVANVKSTSLDIAAELSRLEALTNFELRGELRRLHEMQPPKSLSRDLLLRGITYKIQEREFGGLSKSVLRRTVWRIIGRRLQGANRQEAPRIV